MKKRSVYPVLLFFFLCVSTNGKAQSVEEVLNKVTDFYKNTPQYRVQMNFTLLRGLNGNKVTESYDAFMERNGNYTKNVILGTSVFVFQNGQIVMDQSNKKITYSKDATLSKLSANFNMNSFLEYYKSSQLIDLGEKWICEMVSANRNFFQLPYSKIELHINKRNYSVVKQVLYFANLIPFYNKENKTTKQDYGRMVIALSHDFDAKVDKLKLSDFVTVLPNNNVQLQKDYNDYQLVK
ncbi:hypothetical protein [Allomuricauda sp. R78024]|uniref:hypothetical protein n=1 Tax=Allomuricauda sp. R78024 TaxID=3093867 RepID=UPI0037CB493B